MTGCSLLTTRHFSAISELTGHRGNISAFALIFVFRFNPEPYRSHLSGFLVKELANGIENNFELGIILTFKLLDLCCKLTI